LRTTFASGVSPAASSVLVVSFATLFRSASSGPSSSESAQGVRTTFAAGDADGSSGNLHVFWRNLGQPWEAVVRMKPVHVRVPFRKGVNYSVRLR
jgi:hypothetical protein